jgi:hypothetical protein
LLGWRIPSTSSVDAGVDAAALARVLAILERRPSCTSALTGGRSLDHCKH